MIEEYLMITLFFFKAGYKILIRGKMFVLLCFSFPFIFTFILSLGIFIFSKWSIMKMYYFYNKERPLNYYFTTLGRRAGSGGRVTGGEV